MLPHHHHHHVVLFKSWTMTQNKLIIMKIKTSQFLHIPKSLELPLYHRYFLLKINHITHSHYIPQNLTQMMTATATALEIVRFFHHFH
jgi:hypothetical protein